MERDCINCVHVTLASCPLCIDGSHFKTIKSVVEDNKVQGEGTDCEIILNEQGGKQSKIDYLFTDIDPRAILRVANVSFVGNQKYGDNNWRKISQKDHINHALTHLFKHLAEERTSEDDLAHAAWRLLAALGVEYTWVDSELCKGSMDEK